MSVSAADLVPLVHRGNLMFSDSNPYYSATPFEPSHSIKLSAKLNPYKTIQSSLELSVGKGKGLPQCELLNDACLLENEPSGTPTSSTGVVSLSTGISSKSNQEQHRSAALVTRKVAPKVPKPQWRAPWELSAVISGHLGWVRSIAFDSSNEWFATGSADRTIKIWDFAKCCAGAEGGLKLTLTGHISAVRGLVVSPRHPYLFSAGEDKMVKCWDLEYNKVIRHYHGHLSGVYAISIHPSLDILVTGGRDSVARVWDIRTKHQIQILGGHGGTVSSVVTNSVDPQVITASQDSTVKLWDLAAGKAMTTLTQHKKAVRSVVVNPRELTFISGAADNIKKWQCRDGKFLKNFTGHNSVVNSLAVNDDGVMISSADNGSVCFWDYDSGYCFQRTETIVQPGSLDAEAGIFASCFDLTGSRFISCEADKSIKIWRENCEATEETHPINMKEWTKHCLALKKY